MIDREIKTISFAEAAFSKRGMYLSADNDEAIHLGLREIYVNSLDALTETKAMTGMVQIKINSKDRLIEVFDNGPGILNKLRDDGVYSLVAAATMPHTGSHTDNKNVNSIGTNGIGLAAVAHTSSYFKIISDDGMVRAEAIFSGDSKGASLVSYNEGKSTRTTGVIVQYTPNVESYESAWIERERLVSEVNEMMKFYPNYKFVIDYDGNKTTIQYPNGLRDKSTKVYYESDNLIIALNTNGGGIKGYGNRLFLPNGGAFFSHFKTQLTRTINDLTKLKLRGEQIYSVFGGYLAIFVSNPLFSNQAKTAISNKEVNPEITSGLKMALEDFCQTDDWAKVVKRLEAEAKAEAAAERAREKVLRAKKDFSKKKINTMSEKFCDSDWKNREECRLFLGEGTSATSPIRRVKWPQDATMELRGKILNTCREDWGRVVENKELMMIAKALGASISDNGFVLSKKDLRFGKIVLAADDDVDGEHIISLLMTFFYRYFPEIVKDGRLYTIAPKLFKAKTSKGDYWFGTEKEMTTFCKKNKLKPLEVARYKGRGSMSDEELKPLIDPEHGEFYQITVKDIKRAEESLKLMSNDVSSRKNLVFSEIDLLEEEGYEY